MINFKHTQSISVNQYISRNLLHIHKFEPNGTRYQRVIVIGEIITIK